MANESVQPVLRQLHKMLARQAVKDRTDLDLLQQFATKRDESSFAALVERHGPLVWNVCYRVLRDRHDAEDAFQATFLVLARRASSVCKKEAISSWLYGVAYRTALSQKRAAQRRRRREKQGQIREPEQSPSATASLHELQAMLDEEVARLPAKYRAPFVLCCLEGRSYAQAARELEWKEGTVSSRLAKARELLQARLTCRGVTLSAVLCATTLSPSAQTAPAALIAATTEGVLLSLNGTTTAALSSQAVILAKGATKTLSGTVMKLGAIVLLAAAPITSVGLLGQHGPAARQQAEQIPQAPSPNAQLPTAVAKGPKVDHPGGPSPVGNKAHFAEAKVDEAAEMHVIGIYGAQKTDAQHKGTVRVEVRPTAKPIILVLTSYYSIDWHIKCAEGARIKKAIVSGYFGQQIKGLPADVPLVSQSGANDRGDGSRRKEGWFCAHRWNTPEWREMVRRLNKMTGLPVATFQGPGQDDSFIVDGKRGRDKGQKGPLPDPRAHKTLTARELLTASANAELHIAGIYMPDMIDHPGKPVDVEVRSTDKPVVLVLTSYMESVWSVKLAHGARLKAVLVGGGWPQEIDGVPAEVPIQYFCPDGASFFFGVKSYQPDKYFCAWQWNTREYRRMIERLNDLTGLLVSTFQGQYIGADPFVIDGKRGRNSAQKERKPRPKLPKEPTPRELRAASASADLHVVSIYKSAPDSKNGDVVDVEIQPTDKPIVLALVSYYTVLWNVRIAPGAQVKAVIIGGYFEQEFDGIPAGIPIVCRTYFPSHKEGYFFGHEWNAPDDSPVNGKKVAERLKGLTGLSVATFQGEHNGASFVVDGKRGRDFAKGERKVEEKRERAQEDPLADVADIPSQELRAGGDSDKRYFLIGPQKDAKPPAEGYSLLVILPGGDGSADFHPFVKRIYKNALSDRYLAVQPIAVKWTPDQEIVWPTKKLPVAKMKFSTEEFIDAVIEDAAKKHKIDRKNVFSLSWSSSGPAAYAASLGDKPTVKGSFIAMSVFKPQLLPPLKAAKGRTYYLYHSPDDRICPYRMAAQAKRSLTDNGAKVRLKTYEGGHGWRGNVYREIRQGIEWLEKNRENTSGH